MSGPTLALNVTSPGQKAVEGTTSAVKALAAALRELPKASAELQRLMASLNGGGLKGGLAGGDSQAIVGEIKNLSAQLNTSFLSLEETIKKGWAKAAKAQVEGEAKVKSAAGAAKGMTVASVGAAGQPIEVPLGWFAKMQVGAAKYSEALRKADDIRAAGLEASKIKMQVTSAAWAEKAREAEAKRQAGLDAGLVKMQVTSASWAEAFRVAEAKRQAGLEASKIKLQVTSASWAEQAREAEAKRQAGLEASKIKMQVTSASWAEAFRAAEAKRQAGIEASRIKMQVTSAAWAETAREAAARIEAAQKVLDARYMAMSPRAQARTVLNARSRLDQGVGADAVGGSFGGMALAAAQATTFVRAQEEVHGAAGRANKELEKAPPHLKALTTAAREGHSGLRGLASGFNLMSLTYGSVAPLLAGAALSKGFVSTIKMGVEVRKNLEALRVLSEESETAVGGLETSLLNLARTGPFGPLQIAEAMKTLSLAGLDAQQVGKALKPTLDFAITGGVGIAQAAESLVAIGTAYGYQADQFSTVADAVSKAAAISMSSVDGMMNSFRSSSIVAQAYGVSLKDAAAEQAMLANIGIRGTAAGTSLRQMYSELSGATRSTREAMKRLGVEVVDQSGAMKPMITIVTDLSKALEQYSGKARISAIQSLSNERGSKTIVALLAAIEEKAKAAGTTASNELERIRQLIEESAGFSAIAASKLVATPENLLKGVKSSFEAALLEAFKTIEPVLVIVASQLRTTFNSPEFRSGVASMVQLMAAFTAAVVDNIGWLGKLAAAYGVYKILQLFQVALVTTISLLKAKAEAAAVAATATAAVGAAATAATPALTRFTAAFTLLLRLMGPTVLALSAVAFAWDVYSRSRKDSKTAELEAEAQRKSLTLASLKTELERLEKINDLRRQGLSGIAAETEAIRLQDKSKRAAADAEAARPYLAAVQRTQEAAAAAQAEFDAAPGATILRSRLQARRDEQTAALRQLEAFRTRTEQQNAEIEFTQQAIRSEQKLLDMQGEQERLQAARLNGRLAWEKEKEAKTVQALVGKPSKAFGRSYSDMKTEGQFRLPDLPKTPDPIRVGGVWQQQLDDWKGVKEQLVKDRDEFMTGWIDRGRTMWSDWLLNGKLTFRSLGELFKQTLADITYKRFIAGPLAKAGESAFDSLLKPVSEAKPGIGDAASDLRTAFNGLSDMAKRVGSSLNDLGTDFWRLFVQAGQGLAAMLSSSGAPGIGGFIASLFGGPSGNGGTTGTDLWVEAAKGYAFNQGVIAFAKGGLPGNSVISSPHFFKFGAGGSKLGVAGEAGPEAIMPLSRGPGGELGVRVHGGSGGGQLVAKTSVVIENHTSAQPEVQRETQPDGSELIRVVLNATAKDISRGGAVRKSMQAVASKKNLPRY